MSAVIVSQSNYLVGYSVSLIPCIYSWNCSPVCFRLTICAITRQLLHSKQKTNNDWQKKSERFNNSIPQSIFNSEFSDKSDASNTLCSAAFDAYDFVHAACSMPLLYGVRLALCTCIHVCILKQMNEACWHLRQHTRLTIAWQF